MQQLQAHELALVIQATDPAASDPGGRSEPDEAVRIVGLALDAIDAPALVVARSGQILCANAIARVGLASSPEPPARGEADWTFTPLRGRSEVHGFLAIRRPPVPLPEHELERLVGKAAERWKLTQRQREVLALVARGLTNDLIADTLGISRRTVEFHVTAIFDKAGTANRAMLISRMHET